jgi:hypothetical protein
LVLIPGGLTEKGKSRGSEKLFLRFNIQRKYLYLPTEIINKGRAIHILLGSLEFGSQVVETFFPCAGLHVVGCGGIEVFVSQRTFADADNKYERIENN